MIELFPSGFLIAIEGIDGAGKTSVAGLLSQYCGERGIACVHSKEPTGLKWGQELRRSASAGRLTLEEEIRLFRRDREMHVAATIRPAMETGHVVIVDRYYWSTAAYQGARGADPAALVFDNERFAPRPNMVLLLDLPARIGLDRIHLRGDEPNAFENQEALDRSRVIFQNLALEHADVFHVIDACQSHRAVGRACLQAVQSVAQRTLSSAAMETFLHGRHGA